MLLCKIIVPTKLYFSLPQSNKHLIGIIGHAYHKYQTGVQHISSKYCFRSSLTDACNAMSQVYKIPAATVTTSTRLCVKLFVENENNFAHEIMEMLPTYDVTPSLKRSGSIPDKKFSLETFHHLQPKSWSRESPSNICKAFESISKYVSRTNVMISDEVFTEMCESIVKTAPAFNTSELYMILSSLTMWKETYSPKADNFLLVWKALDEECQRRVEQWDVATLLRFADPWYILHLSKFSKYMKSCIKVLDHQRSTLSPSQLVQSVFYVRTCQTQELISMYEFENYIAMCVDKLSLNELAIVAMSFFKTKTKLKSRYFMTLIIKRLVDEVDTVHEISLAACVKIIRYSTNAGFSDQIYVLFDKLLPKIHTLSSLACVQIVASATSMRIFHEELFKVMSHHFVRNIHSLRLKDVSQILFALTSFDYNPETLPCIYEQIFKELHNHERVEEIKKYPHLLAVCLQNLAFRNIYSTELSNKVLHPQFFSVPKESFKAMLQPLVILDTSIEIEYPSYEGNRLSTEQRHQFCHQIKMMMATTKRSSFTEEYIMQCARILKTVLGDSEYIYCGNILPNFKRPDVVFGLTKGNDPHPVQIPANFRILPLGTVKHPPVVQNNVQWYCLVFGPRSNYTQPVLRPMSMLTAKLRQLRIIGYVPLFIPFYEWPKTAINQKQYLQEKLRLQSPQ